MIVFGTGSKHFETRTLDSEKCPTCGNNTLTMYVFQKYFHIFWIPVFPLSKVAVLECTHCKMVLEDKEMPDTLQRVAGEIKQRYSTPLYLYIGLFLIMVGIGYGIYSGQQEDEHTRLFLAQPRVSDYYVMDIENDEDPVYKYSVFKLTNLSPDSLDFSIGQYAYQMSYQAKDAIKDGAVDNINYFGIALKAARSDIDTSEIVAIIRLSENE